MLNAKEKINPWQLKEPCPHRELCGGCTYQEVPYEEQLKEKADISYGYFKEKEAPQPDWEPIEKPVTGIYCYRNKMEFTFGDLTKDGELTLGMHRKGHFMSIVTVDKCQLVTPDFTKILKFTLNYSLEKGYTKYHKKTHSGLLRNLIIRRGVRTKELLVNIVTSSQGEFNEKDFLEKLLKLDLNDKVVGVLRTINDNIADAVNPEEVKLLWGRDYYMEEIMGLKFKVSAFSFFQTNVDAAEYLYKEAIELIDNIEGKLVFDLYCGTGTIGQVVAKKARKVVGIEIVEEAIEAAKENAKLNGLNNCEFISGDVYEVLKGYKEKPDVIIVDPPRVGMSEKAVDKIISYDIDEILYISCNPKTLAINLRQFEYAGYKPIIGKLYDNFPLTKAVEGVVLLKKEI